MKKVILSAFFALIQKVGFRFYLLGIHKMVFILNLRLIQLFFMIKMETKLN